MKKRKILLRHPNGSYYFVKIGFCWPAFFLAAYWAVVKRMWLFVIPLVGAELLLSFVANLAGEGQPRAIILVSLLAMIAVAIVRGYFGNRWLLFSLRRRGFVAIS